MSHNPLLMIMLRYYIIITFLIGLNHTDRKFYNTTGSNTIAGTYVCYLPLS